MGLYYIVIDLDTKQIVCEGSRPMVYDYVENNKINDNKLKIFVED